MWRWCARQHCAPRVCIPSHCTILPFFFYLHSLDESRSVLAELSRQHEVIFGARGRLMDTQSTATERDGILSLVRIFFILHVCNNHNGSRRLRTLVFLFFSLPSLFSHYSYQYTSHTVLVSRRRPMALTNRSSTSAIEMPPWSNGPLYDAMLCFCVARD